MECVKRKRDEGGGGGGGGVMPLGSMPKEVETILWLPVLSFLKSRRCFCLIAEKIIKVREMSFENKGLGISKKRE